MANDGGVTFPEFPYSTILRKLNSGECSFSAFVNFAVKGRHYHGITVSEIVEAFKSNASAKKQKHAKVIAELVQKYPCLQVEETFAKCVKFQKIDGAVSYFDEPRRSSDVLIIDDNNLDMIVEKIKRENFEYIAIDTEDCIFKKPTDGHSYMTIAFPTEEIIIIKHPRGAKIQEMIEKIDSRVKILVWDASGDSKCIPLARLTDIQPMLHGKRFSLATAYFKLFGKILDKSLTFNDWSKAELDQDEMNYMIMDTIAVIRIHKKAQIEWPWSGI